jgi:hypothetical protein
MLNIDSFDNDIDSALDLFEAQVAMPRPEAQNTATAYTLLLLSYSCSMSSMGIQVGGGSGALVGQAEVSSFFCVP